MAADARTDTAGATSPTGESASRYKLLVMFVSIIWGGGFMVQKHLARALPTFQILTIDFGIAAIVLLALFHKRFLANLGPRMAWAGIACGIADCLGYGCQTLGLSMTTPGKGAFISGCYCVIVPFLGMLFGMGKPEPHNVVAALLCACGLGFIGADGGLPLNPGDVIVFGSAVAFAFGFVLVAKLGDGLDVFALTIWQAIVVASLSLAASLAFEGPIQPASITPDIVLCFAYHGIMSTCFCKVALNLALSKADPTSISLISSLESPFGAAFSLLFGMDSFTARLGIGFALVFLSVVVSEAWRGIRERLRRASGRGRSS